MKKILIALLILGLYGTYTNASAEESLYQPEGADSSVNLDSDVLWAHQGRNHGDSGEHRAHNGRNGRGHRGDWGSDSWQDGPRPGFYEKYGRRDYIYSGQPTY